MPAEARTYSGELEPLLDAIAFACRARTGVVLLRSPICIGTFVPPATWGSADRAC